MNNQPAFDSTLYPTLPTTQLTAQEDALAHWFATQRTQSIEHLEGAARQIINLCTTVLAVLLGVVALTTKTLPGYLSVALIRWLGMVGVLGLFVALAIALVVVMPSVTQVMLNDPADLASAYDKLLAYKNTGLTIAVFVFAMAMLCLTGVILGALLIA